MVSAKPKSIALALQSCILACILLTFNVIFEVLLDFFGKASSNSKKREPQIHSLRSHSRDWILASLPNFLKPVSAIELRNPSFIKLINFIGTCFKEDRQNKHEQKWKMLCWIALYQGPLAILDQIISQQFVLKSLLFCLMWSRMGTHHQKEVSTLKPRLAQPQY